MAKISTYPNVSTPTLSDMLIGTEVTDNNATKNFQISDILGLIGSLGLYVPYTGATSDVDLGTYLIFAGGGTFFGPVYLDDALFDGTGSSGNVGQILSATATGTQWIDPSSFINLQVTLDGGNTADEDIILTGVSNKFEQTGANSFIRQTGISSFIQQTGGTAFISQSGANAFINQSGNNASILQTGTDSLIQQQGIDSVFRQIGANASIQQSGANSYIDQQGANAFITQSGLNSIIEQTGNNAFITQSGANSFIEQTGANASIQQTGANAYISQAGTTGYIQPAQILDSTSSLGVVDEVLVSLGPGLGVQWKDKNQIGSFYDIANQTPVAGVAVPMRFGTNDITGFGVSVTPDIFTNRTQIEVTTTGYYNIQFSAQLRNGAGAAEVDIWFRKNGTDIANSNTNVSMQSNSFQVASWNYLIKLDPGDVFQIMWTQDNSALISAGPISALHPATPSTILTVNRVR